MGHSRSSEPTRMDPPPILLTFHSNHGPISYRFRYKRRFQSKIAKFSHPRVFCAHAKGVALGIGYRCSGSKTRMTGLPGRTKSLTISSAVWIQYTNVTDRQTDGHQETAKTALTHGARGKNVWHSQNLQNSVPLSF